MAIRDEVLTFEELPFGACFVEVSVDFQTPWRKVSPTRARWNALDTDRGTEADTHVMGFHPTARVRQIRCDRRRTGVRGLGVRRGRR
jgi:hypothetical protein